MGCGRVGSQTANLLSEAGHKISIIDIDPKSFNRLGKSFNGQTVLGFGYDKDVLESAGIKIADIVAAVTGDDEDNLVIAQLAKLQPNRPKVIAVNNHPRNEWLFNKKWGIDAKVSSTSVLSDMIEEEMRKNKIICK